MAEDVNDLSIPSSADFEQHFFEGAEVVTLQIKVLQETYQDMLSVIQRNGWEVEEGLRILLTLGLGYAQGRYLLQADDEQRARLADRLTNLESVAAVMKFRTFSFMRDNQVLEMRMNALQTSVQGLQGVIQRLRPERDALQEEVERLRAEIERLRGCPPVSTEAVADVPSGSGSWFDALKSILRSFRRSNHVNHD
jgi:chromosome segregation ATPase